MIARVVAAGCVGFITTLLQTYLHIPFWSKESFVLCACVFGAYAIGIIRQDFR